jgi:hypothetical protein
MSELNNNHNSQLHLGMFPILLNNQEPSKSLVLVLDKLKVI